MMVRDCYARNLAATLVFFALAACSRPVPEIVALDTSQPPAAFLARLKEAIRANGLTVVEGACGTCGIRTIEVEDKDAVIVTVTRPGLMLALLKASAPAGPDPPLRFYISRRADGTARLTYHQPSRALAVYERPALDKLGRELDAAFAHIAAMATQGVN